MTESKREEYFEIEKKFNSKVGRAHKTRGHLCTFIFGSHLMFTRY